MFQEMASLLRQLSSVNAEKKMEKNEFSHFLIFPQFPQLPQFTNFLPSRPPQPFIIHRPALHQKEKERAFVIDLFPPIRHPSACCSVRMSHPSVRERIKVCHMSSIPLPSPPPRYTDCLPPIQHPPLNFRA